jgi:hypothetical protein
MTIRTGLMVGTHQGADQLWLLDENHRAGMTKKMLHD